MQTIVRTLDISMSSLWECGEPTLPCFTCGAPLVVRMAFSVLEDDDTEAGMILCFRCSRTLFPED